MVPFDYSAAAGVVAALAAAGVGVVVAAAAAGVAGVAVVVAAAAAGVVAAAAGVAGVAAAGAGTVSPFPHSKLVLALALEAEARVPPGLDSAASTNFHPAFQTDYQAPEAGP